MQGRTSCAYVPLAIADCMRNVVTDGVKTGSIPIRGGGVKISTDDRRGERCGGHVCKIANWKRGGHVFAIDNYAYQSYDFNEIRQKLKTAEKH